MITEEVAKEITKSYQYILWASVTGLFFLYLIEKSEYRGLSLRYYNGGIFRLWNWMANGHRTKDVLKLVAADGNTVNSTLTCKYDPRDRVTKYEKTGDNARTETYVHDANSNVVAH